MSPPNKTPEEYEAFEQFIEDERLFDDEGFHDRFGYYPTRKQRRYTREAYQRTLEQLEVRHRTLLLARGRREVWAHHYRAVVRDKAGRFIAHAKWSWRKKK